MGSPCFFVVFFSAFCARISECYVFSLLRAKCLKQNNRQKFLFYGNNSESYENLEPVCLSGS